MISVWVWVNVWCLNCLFNNSERAYLQGGGVYFGPCLAHLWGGLTHSQVLKTMVNSSWTLHTGCYHTTQGTDGTGLGKKFPVLLQYFTAFSAHWAADPHGQGNLGDIVLIKRLREPHSDRVYHYLKEVVFKLGEVKCPVTGRRCRGTEFVDEENRRFESLLYKKDTEKSPK